MGAGTVTLDSCILREAYFDGLLVRGGDVVYVTNSVIAGADCGLAAHSSTIHLTNCTLHDNRTGIQLHGGTVVATNVIVTAPCPGRR